MKICSVLIMLMLFCQSCKKENQLIGKWDYEVYSSSTGYSNGELEFLDDGTMYYDSVDSYYSLVN